MRARRHSRPRIRGRAWGDPVAATEQSHFVHWLALFGENIAMGMVVVGIFATLRASLGEQRPTLSTILVGLLFGLSGIASMVFPVQIYEGLHADMRISFVLVGSLFGGPVGALIATALPTAFRLYLGGNGEIAGIAGILSSGVIGYLFGRLAMRRNNDYGLLLLLGSGFLAALVDLIWIRAVFGIEGIPGLPPEAEGALLATAPIANAVIGTSLSMMHPRIWRRTERLLADFVETTSELVWEHDMTGRIVYASQRYVEVLGMPIAEIVGKTPTELGWTPADAATETAYLAALELRQPFRRLLFRQPTKAGDIRLISVTGRPVTNERGHYIGYRGVASDVTEIEKWRTLTADITSKVANLVGDDFLRALVKSVADVLGTQAAYVGQYDFAKGQVHGVYSYARGEFSLRAEHRFADAPSGTIAAGKPLIVPRALKERFPAIDGIDYFKGVEAYGGVPLIAARGNILGILAVVDIRPWESPEYIETVLTLFAGRAAAELDRKIREEENEKSRRKMAEVLTALDVARDAIVLIDADRRVAYYNRSAEEIVGLPEGQSAVGKTAKEWSFDPALVAFANQVTAAVRSSGEWHSPAPFTPHNGPKSVAVEAHARALPGGGIVFVATDATARVKLAEEERRQQQREAQAGKLEALGNLAGGIAHDFNNLLGAVLGFGHFLIEDLPEGSDQRNFAERIVSTSERGRSLVRQILAFSRRAAIEETNILLRDSIAETRDMLRATLPSTTQIEIANAAEEAMVFADKGQIVQVLINLGVNASDALEGAPGTVTIATAPPDRLRPDLRRLPVVAKRPAPGGVETWADDDGTGHIVAGGMPEADCVCLSVTDTGSGIPLPMLDKILEPFVTTKEKGKGTGLGLSVVYRIVTEHGGAMVVTTRQGEGTRFEIILPLSVEVDVEDQRQIRQSAVPPVTASAFSILVVDDDEAHLSMAATALRRVGYRVQATRDPREVLAWSNAGTRWDLMISDQTMPYLRGSDLLSAVKAAMPPIICVIATGSGSITTEEHARSAGAEGFMLKPYDVADLIALVARLLAQKKQPVLTGV